MTAPRRIDVRKLLLGLVLASAVGCGNASSDGACEQGTVGVCNDEGRLDPEPSGNVRTPAPGEPAVSEARSTLRVGETVDFSMYTHCGVESTRINGRVWNAMDPLYSSPERLGPPTGWADPEQDGLLTLEAVDRAVFAALGERVVLVPSQTGEALRPCD